MTIRLNKFKTLNKMQNKLVQIFTKMILQYSNYKICKYQILIVLISINYCKNICSINFYKNSSVKLAKNSLLSYPLLHYSQDLMDIDQIPHQWFCPITQELIIDPVIATDGFTYQRQAIEKWLLKSNTSPVTGKPIENNLIPNHAIRHTINQYRQLTSLKNNPIKKQSALKTKKNIKHFFEQEIQLNIDSIEQQDGNLINLQIITPPQIQPKTKRRPCSLICILDISQSMETDAAVGGKNVQSHGFSRLDLVKHSINTMIQFMNETDEISLIPFNSSAKILLNPTKMTVAGKNLARQRLKQLQANGTTNIWDGLKLSLDVAKTINFQNKNVFTVLLTDGEPNLNPPRGIVPTLKKFIDIEKHISPNIHVFGYGYELDTKLLYEIAQVGNGTYAYIPDCSMVGTVFVNFMANALSTITNMNELSFQFSRQSNFQGVLGLKPKDGKYNLGCLHYGQTRNILLKFKSKNIKQLGKEGKITLKYGVNFQNQASINLQNIGVTMNQIKMQQMKLRFQYLQLLQSCLQCGKKIDESLTHVQNFYNKLKKIHEKNPSAFSESLISQIKNDYSENQGQVEKAYLKKEWYQKWGQHYIPSLFLAHLMQTCTNFKDPALQLYGGKQFHDYQNNMDTIFIKMPPPVPSAKKQKNVVYKPAPVSMSHYYNNYGGCIEQNCRVLMANGLRIAIKDIKKGDKVVSISGKIAEIECMVKTNVFGIINMVRLGNLLITQYHPVYINEKWQFPIEIAKSEKIFVESFYNFVLKGGQSLLVQGYECIGLGHNKNDSVVTSHEYFGTEQIVNDLKKSRNWNEGLVIVQQQYRDKISNKVIGIKLKC